MSFFYSINRLSETRKEHMLVSKFVIKPRIENAISTFENKLAADGE